MRQVVEIEPFFSGYKHTEQIDSSVLLINLRKYLKSFKSVCNSPRIVTRTVA
jgi:hypothetical protein